MAHDRAIAEIAHPQIGLCTRAQLREAGLSDRAIDHRIGSGQLTRRHRGVFALAGAPSSFTQDALAACLATGPGAVASHRAAARLLGLDLRIATPVEVTVPRGRAPRPTGVVVHRTADLSPTHTTRAGLVPTTTAHRTLVDLGAVAPHWVVARALDQATSAGLVTPSSVGATLASLARRGRRGVGVLRQVLDERGLDSQATESALEEAFGRLCRRHHVPAPVCQYGLVVGGRWRRLDFAYPTWRIAVEVDGYAVHRRRDVFEDDRARANELELAGWLVLRFTWRQVTRQPASVAQTVLAAIARRHHHHHA